MLGLGACSTPPVVLDLSEKTAASTAVLQRSLAELSQNSRRITELRAANIARLHAANSAVRARNELDRELLKKTGDSSVPRHVKLLEQWSKKVEEIDSEAKVAAVRTRLEAVGVTQPRLFGSIQPASLHHAVVAGAFATRRCETCHASDSRLTRPFELSSYVPAGARAELVGDTNIELPGRLETDGEGRLHYIPVPTASGRYVIGHDRAGWIDVVGLLAVIGTLLGAAGHGVLRLLAARRARS